MKSKKWLWIRRAAVCTLILGVLTAAVTIYLLARAPQVWRNAQQVLEQTTPEAREQIRANVMTRLAELVDSAENEGGVATEQINPYQHRGTALVDDQIADIYVDRVVELRLTNEELVAIVNETFVDWTIQRGYIIPGGLNDPVVLAQDGQLVVAFMIDTPHWQQVFSGDLELTFSPDGMAHGRVDNLTAGSLPVSIKSVGEMLRAQMPKSERATADRLGDWLAELDGFHFRPTIELQHRRRARVLSMDIGDDSVLVRMRVQDHETYRRHNDLLRQGTVAVTDALTAPEPVDQLLNANSEEAYADVPTTTD